MAVTAATPIQLKESLRLTEGSILPKKREVILTVIRAGFGNKAGNRYYSPSLLERSAKMFEGVKMYADHLTPEQERKLQGGPRSIRELVGSIKESWFDPNVVDSNGVKVGGIKARARIGASWLWDLIENDHELVEVSIDALGTAIDGMVEGRKARMVQSFHRARSVDFVSLGGAGGVVDTILEAQQEDVLMLETISLDALKQHRPDLIEAIKAQESGDGGGENTNDNPSGANVDLGAIIKEAVTEAVAEARTEIEANADKRVALVENRTIVKQMLQEAKLPEVSATSIYESFHDNCLFEADGDKDGSTVLRERVKEAIDNKRAEIRQWLPKGGVSGMGPSATMLEGEGGETVTVATPMHDQLIGSLDLGPAQGGE